MVRGLSANPNPYPNPNQVRAQAMGGNLRVEALKDARVDGHYPVDVKA